MFLKVVHEDLNIIPSMGRVLNKKRRKAFFLCPFADPFRTTFLVSGRGLAFYKREKADKV
jgi:hypothetical protein